MKKRIMLFALVAVSVLAACKNTKKTEDKVAEKTEVKQESKNQKTTQKTTVQLVTSKEASQLLAKENIQLVDVRTPEEVAEGKIEGAVNYIFEKNFKEKIQSLDKTKPVMVYCRSGRRSGICAKTLEEAGFKIIYDIDGGIKAWEKAGLPMVK